MTNPCPIETERKFLIRYPDIAALAAMPGARMLEISQTYLTDDGTGGRRIRTVREAGVMRYIYTCKRRISALSAYEEEREISPDEYSALQGEADPDCRVIEKTRCVVPHGAYHVEIDVYPFWHDRAILEVELPREDAPFAAPDYVRAIREVSYDNRYKNRALARVIPYDNIETE